MTQVVVPLYSTELHATITGILRAILYWDGRCRRLSADRTST